MKLNTILIAAGMFIVGGVAGHFVTKSISGKSQKQVNTQKKQETNNAQTSQNPENPFEDNRDPLASPVSGPTTTMKFDEMEYDFGTIKQGDKVTHIFNFTNTGDEPLIIDNAKGSCGCTVPKWPKDPIAPGEKGELKVEYDSKGKRDQEVKTVTIMANTDPNVTRLTIKAYVDASEAETLNTPITK